MASQIGELFVSISADVSSVLKGIGDTDSALGNLGNNLKSIGSQFTSFGSTLSIAVTAPLAAIGIGSVKTAMDFDTSMRKVQAVTGSTGTEFTKLSDYALKLGADTAFSSSQAAEAMLYMGQAGFSTEQIMAGTSQTMALAAAGALDLGTAASITTNVISGFGLASSDTATMVANTSRVVDVLAQAASSTNTDVSGLGEAMSYIAPIANSMGMSIEETAAMIGVMSNAGIEGSRAGTALRGAIAALTSVSDSAAATLGQYGISMEDVNLKTHSLTEILALMEQRGMSATDIIKVFGTEAGPGVAALLNAGIGKVNDLTTQLGNCEGAAQSMADIMQGGAKGAWDQFSGSVEKLGIDIGRVILEAIVPLLGYLTELVNWLGTVPKPILIAAIAFGAIVAAIGPLLVIIGTLISSVGTISVALGAAGLSGALATVVGILTGPVAIAIAAFIAAAYLVYKNWDVVGPIVKEAFDIILAAIKPVSDSITAFVTGALASLSAWWTTNGPAISQAATTVFNVIGPVFTALSTIILGFVYGALVVLWETFTVAINIIIPLVQFLGAQVGDMIMLVVNLINGDWSAAWQNAQNIVQRSWDFIVSIFNGQLLYNAVKGVWDNVLLIISQTLDLIIGIITGKTGEAATSLKNGMVNAGAEMITGTIGWIPGVSGVVDGIVSKLTEVPTGASQAMTAFGPAVVNPIDATAIQAASHAGTLVTSTVAQIRNMPGQATSALSPLSASITGPIDTASVQAASHAGTLVTGTVNQVALISPRSASVMSGFGPAIVNPINAAVAPASSAANRVGTGATTSLNSGMSPMAGNARTTMGGVATAITGSGSSLYTAAASAGQQAVNGLQSKLSAVRATAAEIRSAISQVNIFTGQQKTPSSGSSSGSSSGGSSGGSTGSKPTSTGAPYDAPSQTVRKEKHATGGVAGYTGWHWMEKNELAVPEQTDWSAVLAAPLQKAMSGILANSGNVSNSYGGDTFVIENVTLSNDYDVDKLFAKFESMQQKKRLQRGFTL